MFHIVESCPLTKLNGGLSGLHFVDEDAVLWLTSYGLWHAYEKKKMYSVEMNKHIFKKFLPSGSHTILVFHTKPCGNSPTGASNAGGVGKNLDSRPISGFRIMNGWSAINSFVSRPCSSVLQLAWTSIYCTDRHISMNLVYHSQHGHWTMDNYTDENRTAFSCTHWWIWSRNNQ